MQEPSIKKHKHNSVRKPLALSGNPHSMYSGSESCRLNVHFKCIFSEFVPVCVKCYSQSKCIQFAKNSFCFLKKKQYHMSQNKPQLHQYITILCIIIICLYNCYNYIISVLVNNSFFFHLSNSIKVNCLNQ